MHITQETDYAIRIVYCLCKSSTRRDARSISDEVGVSLRFSLKILGKLSGAGLVKSYKGNRGGYELAKEPGEISMADVICVVEGAPAVNRCVNGSCACDMESDCPFHSVFVETSRVLNDKLESVTFAQML